MAASTRHSVVVLTAGVVTEETPGRGSATASGVAPLGGFWEAVDRGQADASSVAVVARSLIQGTGYGLSGMEGIRGGATAGAHLFTGLAYPSSSTYPASTLYPSGSGSGGVTAAAASDRGVASAAGVSPADLNTVGRGSAVAYGVAPSENIASSNDVSRNGATAGGFSIGPGGGFGAPSIGSVVGALVRFDGVVDSDVRIRAVV